MIILQLPNDETGAVPMKRFVLKSGREVQPDKYTGRAHVMDEAEATELEAEGWIRQTDKAVDSNLRKSVHQATSRHTGFELIDEVGACDDLLRRAQESQFRRHTGGHEPPEREQIDMSEVDAGSFGRLRVKHHVAHGELSIAGVNSDVDDLDPDLRDAFLRASRGYVDSLENVALQAPAKVTIGALVAAILSRHGYIADAVRRQKFRAKFGV